MIPQTQHWQTRTPLRVQVLGLLFLVLLLSMLGLLSQQWQLSLSLYLGVSLFVVGALTYQSLTQAIHALGCNQQSQFFLLTARPQPVHITQIWQSAWAVCVQVQVLDSPGLKYHCVIWRSAHSLTAWRHLHIHLLRYQLQHSGSATAGTI